MNRETFYSTVLPMIDASLRTIVEHVIPRTLCEDRMCSLAILGPTADELETYAPFLFEQLGNSNRSERVAACFHRELKQGGDIVEAIERCCQWSNPHPDRLDVNDTDCFLSPIAATVLVPPDFDVRSPLPGDQSRLTPDLGQLNPNFELLHFVDNFDFVCTAIPADDLVSDGMHQLKESWFDDVIRRSRLSATEESRLRIERNSSQESITIGEWDPTPWLGARAIIRPPHSLWRIQEGNLPSRTDPVLVYTSRYESIQSIYLDPCIHTRCFSREYANFMSSDMEGCSVLFDMLTGEADRCSDDVFVSVYDYIHRKITGWQYPQYDFALPCPEEVANKARRHGWPLIEVGRLCQSIESTTTWDPGVTAPDCLWYIAEGSQSGRASIEAPERTDASRVFRLQCDDPVFLGSILNEAAHFTNISCRSAGSLLRPCISKEALVETKVPWPAPSERAKMHRLMQHVRHQVDNLAEPIEDLQGTYERLYDSVIERESNLAVPLWHWPRLVEPLGEIVNQIRTFIDTDKEMHVAAPAIEQHPFPTSFAYRRFQHEIDNYSRMRWLLYTAEILVRYDTCLMIAIAQAAREIAVQTVLGQISSSGNDKEWHLTMGSWRFLQSQLRRQIPWLNIGRRLGANWRPIIDQISNVREHRIKKDFDPLLQCRNAQAHGAPADHDAFEASLQKQEPHLDGLLQTLDYLSCLKTFVVESQSKERIYTTINGRSLMGDNSAFPSLFLEYETSEAPQNIHNGDVYTCCNETSPPLSLYPWLRYDGLYKGSPKTVWIFDGIDLKKKCTFYISPQTQEKLEVYDSHTLSDIRTMVGM